MAYTVFLESRGNIDRGQDPNVPVFGVSDESMTVYSFEEASEACRSYAREHGLGQGSFTGGRVVDGKGRDVAQVFVSGVVFPPGPMKLGQKPLYVPPDLVTGGKADPYEKETAVVEVPGYGPIRVGGCFRVGLCDSVPGKFFVNGERTDFMTYAEFKPKGFKRLQKFNLLPGGELGMGVPTPKEVHEAISDAVREWAGDPANYAMIVRNEILDRRQDIDGRLTGIERLEREISTKRQENAQDERTIANLETMLERMEPEAGGPRPR